MISSFLKISLIIAYVALACYLTYKITITLMDKVIDLCFDSPKFRIGLCLILSLAFCALGLLQLTDYLKGTGPSLALFFPLSFSLSGILLFLGIWLFRYREH